MQIILYGGDGAIRELDGRELTCTLITGEPENFSIYRPSKRYRGDARPALMLDGRVVLALDPIEDADEVPTMDRPLDPVWLFELPSARKLGLYRVDLGGSKFWELAGSWMGEAQN